MNMVNDNTKTEYYNIPFSVSQIANKQLPAQYKLVFAFILSFKKTGFFASNDYICKKLGLEPRTAQRALASLEKLGLIKRTQTRNGLKVVKRTITPVTSTGAFYGIPSAVFTNKDIKATDKLLYGVVIYTAFNSESTQTNSNLGKYIGIRGQQVSNGLQRLKDKGLIDIKTSKHARTIIPKISLYTGEQKELADSKDTADNPRTSQDADKDGAKYTADVLAVIDLANKAGYEIDIEKWLSYMSTELIEFAIRQGNRYQVPANRFKYVIQTIATKQAQGKTIDKETVDSAVYLWR